MFDIGLNRRRIKINSDLNYSLIICLCYNAPECELYFLKCFVQQLSQPNNHLTKNRGKPATYGGLNDNDKKLNI